VPAIFRVELTTGVVPKFTFQISPPVEKLAGEEPPIPVILVVQLAKLLKSRLVPVRE
jgi:hypothetical protein